MTESFRVYRDEEVMLKVYNRRLQMADGKFDKAKPELDRFIQRYQNLVELDQLTEEGHRVSVTSGIGLIDTMFSSMTAVDVEFLCRVIGHGTREQAKAATAGLNQFWRDSKGSRRAKKAVKDSLLVDIGLVKVYYDYQEDEATRDRPTAAVEAEMYELLGTNPALSDQELAGLVAGTEKYQVVLRDRVCIDYVPWDKVRYDPSAKQWEDVRWVAQYTPVPVPEVTQNPQYRAFVEDRYGVAAGRRLLDDLEGDATIDTGMQGDFPYINALPLDDESDDPRVTLVEMWDFETGLVTIFPKNHADLVFYQRPNPLMVNIDLEDRNPFKALIVRDDPTRVAGLGDMRIIFPALEELDEYRTNMAEHISRTIPKVIGPARALTPRGKKAFESRVWGEYVDLEEGHVRQEIGTIELPKLAQEMYAVPSTIKDEMKEATGVSETLRGVFPEHVETATTAKLVTNAGVARQAERRAALEDWYLDIAKTALQLMQQFYNRDRMLRYIDDLGQEFVWSWNAEDIAIDADLGISITPRENPTKAEEFQRALQVMNLALPLPETDRGELMRYVLGKAGLRDDEVRRIIKSDEEVQKQQQADAAGAALSAAPQSRPGSPPGLTIGGG